MRNKEVWVVFWFYSMVLCFVFPFSNFVGCVACTVRYYIKYNLLHLEIYTARQSKFYQCLLSLIDRYKAVAIFGRVPCLDKTLWLAIVTLNRGTRLFPLPSSTLTQNIKNKQILHCIRNSQNLKTLIICPYRPHAVTSSSLHLRWWIQCKLTDLQRTGLANEKPSFDL